MKPEKSAIAIARGRIECVSMASEQSGQFIESDFR